MPAFDLYFTQDTKLSLPSAKALMSLIISLKGCFMKIQIEDIKKEERKYFRDKLLQKENRLNVYFVLDKAIIEVTEPYIINEDWLIKKSQIKNNINDFLSEFRLYQFIK